MPLFITPITAAVLVVLYVKLTFAVINIRRRDKATLGDQGNPALLKAIRSHANLTEWAPLALILLAMLELNGAPSWLVAVPAVVFVIGRFIHPIGINDENKATFKRRVQGMQLTILAVIAMAVLNVDR
jgi:uncharacterized membrane protein YecN with MAPEG domain